MLPAIPHMHEERMENTARNCVAQQAKEATVLAAAVHDNLQYVFYCCALLQKLMRSWLDAIAARSYYNGLVYGTKQRRHCKPSSLSQ